MTIENAIEQIKKDWAKFEHDLKGGHESVWVAVSDLADSYEVDEEWIGIKGDGSLVWAYASGCSCWDGTYDTNVAKEVKVMVLVHKHLPEEWEKAIIKFAEEGKLQVMPTYNRYA